MKRLTLQRGDKVTLVHHHKGDSKLIVYKVAKPGDNFENNAIIYNSTLHKYLERIGINPTYKQRLSALSFFPKNQRRHFRHIELLEVEKKEKWYTSILHRLQSWLRKK